jgi:hypothetical protein
MDLTMLLLSHVQSKVFDRLKKNRVLRLFSTPIFRIHGSLYWAAVFFGGYLLFLQPNWVLAQQSGDYRSAGSGFWTQTTIWEVFTEGSWVPAVRPPSELEDIEISIEAGSTVTIQGEYISDQNIVVKQDAILIHTGEWEEYFNFFELHIYGRFVRAGEAEHGEFEFPNIFVHEGGIYEHNIDGGDLAYVEWLPGAVLEFTGINFEMPNCFNDPVYHLVWNCPNQNVDIVMNPFFSNLVNINGDFSIVNTNGFYLIISNGTRYFSVNGDLVINQNCKMSFNESGGTRTLVEKIEFILFGDLINNGIINLQRRVSGRTLGNYFFIEGNIFLNSGYIFSSSTHNSDRIIYFTGGDSSETVSHEIYEIDGYFGENIRDFIVESFNKLNLSNSLGFSINVDRSFSNYGNIVGNDTVITRSIFHYPDASLSPGNSIGALVIDGNLDAFGGNVLIQIDGQRNDSLVITGQAFFEGGNIIIEEIGEGMLMDLPYVILFYEGLDTGDPNFHFPTLVFPTQDSLYSYEWQENKLIVIKEESFLPVRLQSFTAHLANDKVSLHWETASEKDSDYFSIQRLGANNQWESIGSLKAKGFSETQQNYQFIDDHPPLGRAYYRLIQWDYSGISQIYGPVSVLVPSKTGVQIYPTLFQDGIWVYWDQEEEGEFSLFNLTGENFHFGKWNPGVQWLALEHLPAGAYLLQWWDGYEKQSLKLWKP